MLRQSGYFQLINQDDFGLKVNLMKYCSQVSLILTSSNFILTFTLYEPNLQVCVIWKKVVSHSTNRLFSKILKRQVWTHSPQNSRCLIDHLDEYQLLTMGDLKYFTFVVTEPLPFLTLKNYVNYGETYLQMVGTCHCFAQKWLGNWLLDAVGTPQTTGYQQLCIVGHLLAQQALILHIYLVLGFHHVGSTRKAIALVHLQQCNQQRLSFACFSIRVQVQFYVHLSSMVRNYFVCYFQLFFIQCQSFLANR